MVLGHRPCVDEALPLGRPRSIHRQRQISYWDRREILGRLKSQEPDKALKEEFAREFKVTPW